MGDAPRRAGDGDTDGDSDDREMARRLLAERIAAERVWEQAGGRLVAGLAVGVLTVGTVAYHFLEGWSWIDSLYFSTVAVTTVGFGDLSPTTDLAKLFTVFYLLSGVAVIGLYIDQRVSARRKRASRRRARS